MHHEPRQIRREVLPSGLTLITEAMPHARSIAVGVWVPSGSRHESDDDSGISHFIEHMLFKGTERRSAEDIAREMDRLGTALDAFTAKEMICLNTRVLDAHFAPAFDVLADMVLRPRFADDDIRKEKSVILEELKMEQDNPEYLVSEIFSASFWNGHPLGRPILGTRHTVDRFGRSAVHARYAEWFAPSRLLITAAGNLRHEEIAASVTREFGAPRPPRPAAAHLAERGKAPGASPPQPCAALTVRRKKSLEQVQVCLGVPAYPASSTRRYALSILNYLLGGGASSRLFQTIREDRGLAYSIFSDVSPYTDAGMLCVYAGTSREALPTVLRLTVEEFARLKRDPIPGEELARAKDHLKGSLLLGLETSGARMSHLARQELYFKQFFTIEELSAAIDRVTAEEIQQLCRDLFSPERIAVAALGDLDGFHLSRSLLEC